MKKKNYDKLIYEMMLRMELQKLKAREAKLDMIRELAGLPPLEKAMVLEVSR